MFFLGFDKVTKYRSLIVKATVPLMKRELRIQTYDGCTGCERIDCLQSAHSCILEPIDNLNGFYPQLIKAITKDEVLDRLHTVLQEYQLVNPYMQPSDMVDALRFDMFTMLQYDEEWRKDLIEKVLAEQDLGLLKAEPYCLIDDVGPGSDLGDYHEMYLQDVAEADESGVEDLDYNALDLQEADESDESGVEDLDYAGLNGPVAAESGYDADTEVDEDHRLDAAMHDMFNGLGLDLGSPEL